MIFTEISKADLQEKIDNISLLSYCNYNNYSLKSNTLLYCIIADSIFFIDNYNGFSYGFYITDDINLLSEYFAYIKHNIANIVIKEIYRKEENSQIVNILLKNGFKNTSTYSGYKVKLNYDITLDIPVTYADLSDLDYIHEAISKNFNIVSDEVLTKNDLSQMIKDRKFLILPNKGAFIMCFVINNLGYHSFLYSNGAKYSLKNIIKMSKLFYKQNNAKYFLCWVRDNNDISVKLHKHFYKIKDPKQKFSIYE